MTSSTSATVPVLGPVARYYAAKIAQFGPTPSGVDWNSAEGQERRFEELAKLFGAERTFSINDVGCGYGALYDYLIDRGFEIDYRGYDISDLMLHTARRRTRSRGQPRFLGVAQPMATAEYSVASGIFNVMAGAAVGAWTEHVHQTLEEMNRASRLGFAFNCLTSHADPGRQRSDLFYADPGEFLDLCIRRFSRSVALLHDYGLFEFTILVRKRPA